MEINKNTLYIIGNSKSQQNNPITHVYGAFFIGFLVNQSSSIILDVESNAIISLTNSFIKSIFIGKSMEMDFDIIKNEVEKRYLGSSQKGIIVAFKDAQKKFFEHRSGKCIDF